ncbi:MAG: ParB/RepB/Spo0J family partition protein [bacterium]|nr:ParB/RepB/Spo0J family partition protein [bacterium]
MAKKKHSFADAGAAAKNDEASTAPIGPNLFEQRMKQNDRVRQTENIKGIRVDPAECKLWEHHNRFYDRLNEKNCRSLIESFLAQGKQEEPAYVRRIDEGPYKYEIIAGARRFWTVNYLRSHNYPDFQFFIVVKDINDEEAFRLADLENYARNDLSAYERALDYKRALDSHYDGEVKVMADRMHRDPQLIYRYIRFGKIPKQIAECFDDINDFTLKQGLALTPALDRAETANALLSEATLIKVEQASLTTRNEQPIKSTEVFKRLKEACQPNRIKKRQAGRIYGDSQNPAMIMKNASKSGVTLYVPNGSGANRADLLKLVDSALEEYWSET